MENRDQASSRLGIYAANALQSNARFQTRSLSTLRGLPTITIHPPNSLPYAGVPITVNQ